VLLFVVSSANCQTTVILQPNSANGKDGFISDNVPNSGQGNSTEFDAAAWTIGGVPLKIRSLIEFDLTSIPAGVTIQSAVLTLYNNPNSVNGNGNGQHVNSSGSNAAFLQRITSPWTEDVTWNTQPTTTTLNQVTLPQNTDPFQNYQLNVKTLLEDIIANPSAGYGFLLKLETESPFRLLAFASSNHPNAALHPKLEVTYVCNLVTLQPNAANGKDGFISDNNPNSGQGNSPEFDAGAWTIGGVPLKIRSLIDFDLNSVPAGATIQSAVLTLYNNPNSVNGNGNGQHVNSSGSNAAFLQRITSPWIENVTWNNQPTTTTLNQVTLPQNIDPFQNYQLNVKQLLQDIIANPSAGYGFMLKLETESPFRLLAFASSDHPNAALHPKLEICYTTTLAANNTSLQNEKIIVYPNPTKGIVHIEMNNSATNATINMFSIYDSTGKKVFQKQNIPTISVEYDISNLQNGMYYWTLTSNQNKSTGKLIMAK
jgi:hypothetical protein